MAWILRHLVVGSGIRTVSYQDRFRMYCDSDSYPSVMAACGFVYRHMDRVLNMILQPPVTFLDVGANVGFVTLLACSKVRSKEGKIVAHCFEPDPGVFTWLSENQSLNSSLFEMVANPCAVGAVEGEGELTISARSGWSTMAHEPAGGFSFLPKAGKTMVRVTTLDAYCREHGLSPTVIKIDVEGLEKEVLTGAMSILEQSRPYLLIEINPLRLAAAGTTGEDLIQQLSLSRYRLFHIDPRCVKPVHHAKRDEWRGLPEVRQDDLVMGQDFDALAVPEELATSPHTS
ncbi:MAG: FkbM family methyltransferase [Sulfuricaulis sp.]|uniref:FkbM family methyltransferase n=1 Tax=Sulfuricaulis sp. TaxID=2003553 RepID=UPI0025F8D9A7|nr:FkbM family methyltransferase [Sulfuricaulis sp.]MCR4348020.1 FkbM family methyltransferase [Sulfuricaulis sp.]